jgi:hypothetical protein
MTSPASISFPSLALSGADQTQTTTAVLTPDDQTGTGAGWSVTVYATPLTDAGNRVLPAPWVTGVAAAPATGNCSMPTNSISFPTTGFGTTAGTATRIYSAAASTGSGPVSLTPTFAVSVLANQKIGAVSPDTFSATWTVAIASGP